MRRLDVRALLALTLVACLLCTAQQAKAEVAPRTVAPTQVFEVGMLRVEHFRAAGKTPLIFIPALYCGSWEWNKQIALLAGRFDMYAVTLPGFDGRPRDHQPHLMERAAASVAQLIRERRLQRPIVIGHSLGGTISVLFGETYPNDAAGIIAVEGGYPVAPTAAERERRADAASQPYLGVDSQTFAKRLRANQLQFVITSKSDVDAVSRYADRSDPTAVALWLRAALNMDLTPQLGRIRVPFVEIVPYSRDIDPYRGFPTLAAKRNAYLAWVAHARNGRVIMIDDARHFVMFDRPAAFDRALLASISAMQ